MWNGRDALCHHGIKGMKWGVRRFQNPDGSWTAAGRERYGKGGNPRASLGGASVGSSSNQNGRLTKVGSSLSKDPETGFHKIVKAESDADRLARCNPNFKKTTDISPYNRNCGNTVIADALRKRGLDVEARGNNLGLTVSDMDEFFEKIDPKKQMSVKAPKLKNSTIRSFMFGKGNTEKATAEIKKRGEQVQNEIGKQIASSFPDGSSGAVSLTGMFGSHWISFDVKNGKTTFSNPQDPNEDLLVDFGCYKDWGKQNPATAVRLDNAKVNKNTIGNVVMDYGDTQKDSKGMDWNPLKTKGNEWMTKNPKIEQSVYRTFGNKWDGSWESFSPQSQEYIKKAKVI